MSRHHWYIVNTLVIIPRVRSTIELKWNHITSPDVMSRAERAPVRGHGLGLTMWYECIWWVIRCYHVSISLLVG